MSESLGEIQFSGSAMPALIISSGLNLGCGFRKLEGYINVDKEPKANPDICWDLEQTPWTPFQDNEFETVMASHVLEHLGTTPKIFCNIMVEIHRVLKPGGVLTIKTPHHYSDGYWGDPTHIRPVTPTMMTLFSKENCAMFLEKGMPNTPLAHYLDIDLKIVHVNFTLQEPWVKKVREEKLPEDAINDFRTSFNNVIDEVVMTLHKIPKP